MVTKRTFSSLFLFLLVAACATQSNAATWFVNAAATGANNGTSATDAWTTLGAIAQQSLSPGDTVEVYSGTYNEQFKITKSGAAGRLITYKGFNSGGGNPILLGILGAER